MILPVTPETHLLHCLLLMAVAFIAAMIIMDLPAPAPQPRRRRAKRRAYRRGRANLRVISPRKAVEI